MMTRRRAKLLKVNADEKKQPDVIATTLMDSLGEDNLQHIFSFLTLKDLVQASQVCRQWRYVCGFRRLWANRKLHYDGSDAADCLRVVRTLRRSHGVVHFVKVVARMGVSNVMSFEDNGDTLMVRTDSSFMLLMALRNLVKAHVTALHLHDEGGCVDGLTACEAWVVWETICSKRHLQELYVVIYGHSVLASCKYECRHAGCLRNLAFTIVNVSGTISPCRPIRSLMRVNMENLDFVQIEREDQQALLEECPPYLSNLAANLGPSLLKVLRPMLCLRHLFLHPAKNIGASRTTLKGVLSLPNLQKTLFQLELSLKTDWWRRKEGQGEGIPDDEALLRQVRGFDALIFLRLEGMCGVLTDPERGPAVFKSLLEGLPALKDLWLDVEPCKLPMEMLFPPTTTRDATAKTSVMSTLRYLTFAPEEKELQHSSHSSGTWLLALRRAMDAAPNLHVRLEKGCECVFRNARRPLLGSRTVVLPHPAEAYCKDCEVWNSKKKTFGKKYIRHLFED